MSLQPIRPHLLWKDLKIAESLPPLQCLDQLINHGVHPITLADVGHAKIIENMLKTNEAQAVHTIISRFTNSLNFHIYENIWDYLDQKYTNYTQLQPLKTNLLQTYIFILNKITQHHVQQCQTIKLDKHTTTPIHGFCEYCVRQSALCRYRMNFQVMCPLPGVCDNNNGTNDTQLHLFTNDSQCTVSKSGYWDCIDITTYQGFATCPLHKKPTVLETVNLHLYYMHPKVRVGQTVEVIDRYCGFLAQSGNFTKVIQVFQLFLSKTLFSNDYTAVVKFCNTYNRAINILSVLQVYRQCLLNLNCYTFSQQLCAQFSKFLKEYVNISSHIGSSDSNSKIKPILIESVIDQEWEIHEKMLYQTFKSNELAQATIDSKSFGDVLIDDLAIREDITSFLIFIDRWEKIPSCMNGFRDCYQYICNKLKKFTKISIADIEDCAMAARISLTLARKNKRQFLSPKNIFNKTFSIINRVLIGYPKQSLAEQLQCHDFTVWNEKRNPAIFNLFFCYAIFLFDMKCKKATKYFDYCLYLRPTNGYLHYIYSNYLMIVMKKYKESYFHLRMSKRLWPGLHIQSKAKDCCNHSNKQHRETKALNGTNYPMYITNLCKKMNKHHRCYLSECDKVLSQEKLLICGGCKSAHYCSKLCQKKDWKLKHKQECVGKYLEQLNENEKRINNQILQMLDF